MIQYWMTVQKAKTEASIVNTAHGPCRARKAARTATAAWMIP